MHFHDLFRKQTIRDRSFRMSFATDAAKQYLLFSKYAASYEYRATCKHIYTLNRLNPEIDHNLLDFETEGRWFCQQNWVTQSRTGFPGFVTSKIAFELQADYAMFRMFGFGE